MGRWKEGVGRGRGGEVEGGVRGGRSGKVEGGVGGGRSGEVEREGGEEGKGGEIEKGWRILRRYICVCKPSLTLYPSHPHTGILSLPIDQQEALCRTLLHSARDLRQDGLQGN